MFKSQTNRESFPNLQLIGFFLVTVATCSSADATSCEGLFLRTPEAKASSSILPANLDSFLLDSFLLKTAEHPSAAQFAEALLSEMAKSPTQRPTEAQIYRLAIAPAVWSYARLSTEKSPTLVARSPEAPSQAQAPSSNSVNQLVNQLTTRARQEVERARPQGDAHIRPKAMTRDEIDQASAVGHFGFIDGSRIQNPKSREAERRGAIEAMILQAQRAYGSGPRVKPADDLVRLEFKRLEFERPPAQSAARSAVAKSEMIAVLESPADFAIVYAQLIGLTARSGQLGDALSPFVPWLRPSANPEKFRALRMLVTLAQAMHPAGNARQEMDDFVLEFLRQEFAPHLAAKEFPR